MHKKLAVLGLSVLILATGCAQNATPEPDYDKVDLIHYESCIKYALENGIFNKYLYTEMEMENAIRQCQKYLPIKG